MKYPKFLKKGDTIGFVAPSFGCPSEPYRSSFVEAQGMFTKRGYKLDLGPNCYADSGIGISNTPQLCGKELTEYYCSKHSQFLVSCGGGELMCETLNYVDFEKIAKADPKWYIGFSDNTNFTFLLTTICDVASIYGPCAGTFGMKPVDISIVETLALMEGKKLSFDNYKLWEKEAADRSEDPLAPYQLTEKTKVRSFFVPKDEPAVFSGRLIGGCLDCLYNLSGTIFDHVAEFNERYKEDGIIWYLEACDLNVFGIRRAIWNLKNCGWFQYTKGFLIGRPLCFGQEMMGLDQYNAVTDILKEYQVPVIMDLDIGHLPPMMPLINGALADIKVEKGNFHIDMRLE